MRVIGNVPLSSDKAEITAVASGALATGDTVVVNSDGTVSVVGESSFSAGTPVVVDSTPTSVGYVQAVYDTQNEKIVVVYSWGASSDKGYAAVGTVSGTSISFGTPVQFASEAREIGAAYYGGGKIVIVFRNGAVFNHGHAIAGTVSGSSITFGTAQKYIAGDSYDNVVGCDPNTGGILIAFKNNNQSGQGYCLAATLSGTTFSFGATDQHTNVTDWQSIVFHEGQSRFLLANRNVTNSGYGEIRSVSVSGTTVSLTAATYFNSASTLYTDLSYDSVNEKAVISYADGANSNSLTSKVVTLTGTTISLGAATSINSGATSAYIGSSYNPVDGVHTMTYYDGSNSNYGTAVEATVSGTSISFGTPIVFESAASSWNSSAYDDTANKVVNAYVDGGNSSKTTATVISNGSTNITSENFIGFAKHGYADTQRATIQTGGAINKDQTGLTAGQTYYVQTDGSLSTTAGDPSVVAGTAISSTDLIVKG